MLWRERIMLGLVGLAALGVWIWRVHPDWILPKEDISIQRYAFLKDGRWGYLDRYGREKIPPGFERAPSYFENGPAPVYKDGVWGYIDARGATVIPFQFRNAQPFSEGLAAVAVKQNFVTQWGYIRPDGSWAIEPRFDEAGPFHEERAAVKVRKWGYVDPAGKWVIDPSYDSADHFSEGLAAVRQAGRRGFVNRYGFLVIPIAYQDAGMFRRGLVPVKQKGLWGYLNSGGEWTIEPTYRKADNFTSEGLAAVDWSTGRGYIDGQGRLAIANNRFQDIRSFSEGLAAVALTPVSGKSGALSRWGFINTSGDLVIEDLFARVKDFEGGLASVALEQNKPVAAYINKQGQYVWDPDKWGWLGYTQRWILQVTLGLFAVYVVYMVVWFKNKRRRYHDLDRMAHRRSDARAVHHFWEDPYLHIENHGITGVVSFEKRPDAELPDRIVFESTASGEGVLVFYKRLTSRALTEYDLGFVPLMDTGQVLFDRVIHTPAIQTDETVDRFLNKEIMKRLINLNLEKFYIRITWREGKFIFQCDTTIHYEAQYQDVIYTLLACCRRVHAMAVSGVRAAEARV